jgi:glycosyltransferase involved in cell wall biosynthesis
VRDGATGRLVQPGAISEFADALEAYCTNKILCQQTAIAATQASLSYSWDAINQSLIDTYVRILNARKS